MDNYINSTLVHWTGRDKNDETAFEILKKNNFKSKNLSFILPKSRNSS